VIVGVLIAIDLDDQFSSQATKVRDVGPNRHLTPKMSAVDRQTMPQVPP